MFERVTRQCVLPGTLLLVFLLWRQPWVLGGLLLVGNIVINWGFGWRFYRVALLTGFFGALAEVFFIHVGVWQYGDASFWGIPAWLPFCWGAMGLMAADFLEIHPGIVGNKKHPAKNT
jgi:hypothetical protein